MIGRPSLREKHDGALADRSNVRLWLRLLSCTMVIEKRLKRRFAEQHGFTLPRFDVMAALDRHPDGMTMSDLSRSLLVSNGNVTMIVQALQKEGFVQLAPSASDRRASIVSLTAAGRRQFAALADQHHQWIDAMLSGLDRRQRDTLFDLLGVLKTSIADDNGETRA